jgi:non-heme chloroperoxidase
MSTVRSKDGVEIFYKDWGPKNAEPIVFHHGWPLSSDDWDNQMIFFLGKGYRVIAHDRRGHGRSSQVSDGHDMDHYADDLAALTTHLDLKNAVHVGHSTGGGEVVHYLGRHGESRVAKAAILSAVPPLMVQPLRIQVGCRSPCSTISNGNLPPIVRSSISRSLQGRSMASIDLTESHRSP